MRQLLKMMNYAAQLMALIDIGMNLNTGPQRATSRNKKNAQKSKHK